MNQGGWSGHTAWQVRLPLTEARCLTNSTYGPLAAGKWPHAGTARHLGAGLVQLDWLAFASLQVLDSNADGHIAYDGDTPVLAIGGGTYPLTPAGGPEPDQP
jgi:hypothetical protein